MFDIAASVPKADSWVPSGQSRNFLSAAPATAIRALWMGWNVL